MFTWIVFLTQNDDFSKTRDNTPFKNIAHVSFSVIFVSIIFSKRSFTFFTLITQYDEAKSLITRWPAMHPYLNTLVWPGLSGVEMARRYGREFEVHASNVGAQLEIELSSTREVVRCLYNVPSDCNAETIRSRAG